MCALWQMLRLGGRAPAARLPAARPFSQAIKRKVLKQLADRFRRSDDHRTN